MYTYLLSRNVLKSLYIIQSKNKSYILLLRSLQSSKTCFSNSASSAARRCLPNPNGRISASHFIIRLYGQGISVASLLLASTRSAIFYFAYWCIIVSNSYSQGEGTLIGPFGTLISPNSSGFGRQLLLIFSQISPVIPGNGSCLQRRLVPTLPICSKRDF